MQKKLFYDFDKLQGKIYKTCSSFSPAFCIFVVVKVLVISVNI